MEPSAKALDLTLRACKTVSELLAAARQTPPSCVIVDLQSPGLVIDALVNELRTLEPTPTLIGYGSHVDAATLKKARDAGCDVVWPRSKFAEELPVALPLWFAH